MTYAHYLSLIVGSRLFGRNGIVDGNLSGTLEELLTDTVAESEVHHVDSIIDESHRLRVDRLWLNAQDEVITDIYVTIDCLPRDAISQFLCSAAVNRLALEVLFIAQ